MRWGRGRGEVSHVLKKTSRDGGYYLYKLTSPAILHRCTPYTQLPNAICHFGWQKRRRRRRRWRRGGGRVVSGSFTGLMPQCTTSGATQWKKPKLTQGEGLRRWAHTWGPKPLNSTWPFLKMDM